jgi:hypothetical protein
MAEMRVTTNKRDHQKTIEETDTVAKEEDPAITTTMAPTTK